MMHSECGITKIEILKIDFLNLFHVSSPMRPAILRCHFYLKILYILVDNQIGRQPGRLLFQLLGPAISDLYKI
jgi:hypothetical protein